MREIQLTQGKVALVDDEDYERVMACAPWSASWESRGHKWYCKRRRRKSDPPKWRAQRIRLHHFVLDIAPWELPEGHVVHHKDNNGLNCQKDNLEIITEEQNMLLSEGWTLRWKKRTTKPDTGGDEPWL